MTSVERRYWQISDIEGEGTVAGVEVRAKNEVEAVHETKTEPCQASRRQLQCCLKSYLDLTYLAGVSGDASLAALAVIPSSLVFLS